MTVSLFSEIRTLYRDSLKPSDIFWNLYVARPIAAVLLVLLRRLPITPNQVSFLGLFLFFGVPATMIALPGAWGFLIGALVLELSYVFDCADGQLARLKKMTSDVGAYLDFLIDEIKALLLVGGVAGSLYREHGDERWLIAGLVGVILASAATSITTFIRRPEYAGETIRPGANPKGDPPPPGLVGKAVWSVMALMKWIVHYPSWILYAALLGLHPNIDGAALFLALYLGVYLLYLGRTALGVLLRLGSPGFYRRDES